MAMLVTGGGGFIGSHVSRRLLGMGQDVVILDNFNDYYDPSIKHANIADLVDAIVIEGDIRDEYLVANIFNEHSITHVIHLAAMPNVRYSKDHPLLYSSVNTHGSVILMEMSRQYDVELFILASTSSVYGNTSKIPFEEGDVANFPLAPYPASKRSAELFAHCFHNLYGLNMTVLRFFNVYGPAGRPDMMPLKVIEYILSGETIPLFDGGSLQRDWTYIDDTVDGIIAALNRPMGYEIINLGYGNPVAFSEFIHIYENLIGKKAITHDVPAPLTEPKITFCNNRRARDLLGFDPKTSLLRGLANTWQSYKPKLSMKGLPTN